MPMSLKCMIDKWLHKGQISQEEYDAVIKKLDGHNKQIRAEVIDEYNKKIDYLKNCYVDTCNMCTSVNCEQCHINQFIEDLEQLKGAEE